MDFKKLMDLLRNRIEWFFFCKFKNSQNDNAKCVIIYSRNSTSGGNAAIFIGQWSLQFRLPSFLLLRRRSSPDSVFLLILWKAQTDCGRVLQIFQRHAAALSVAVAVVACSSSECLAPVFHVSTSQRISGGKLSKPRPQKYGSMAPAMKFAYSVLLCWPQVSCPTSQVQVVPAGSFNLLWHLTTAKWSAFLWSISRRLVSHFFSQHRGVTQIVAN